MFRVLELGSYILPAYAGMILAEQEAHVIKWTHPDGLADPVQKLRRGDELWTWINHGKTLKAQHVRDVVDIPPGQFDVVIDNIRASAWEKWGIDPAAQAQRLSLPWVSMRDEFDDRSFDAVAQARAWMEHVPYLPFYIGDTAGGLWAAFKALSLVASSRTGHHVLRQSSCLAKLVEGELVVVEPRDQAPPWDPPGTYGVVGNGNATRVEFRGTEVVEPIRDTAWKLHHLHHDGNGRIII
ncbi:CoA transferase [Natronoglycomyces albus]|uniref:CoA transferase n=1 Tax=Natronoglycomyces albus TaxID=2811108 RepID=A0A895XM87_9ACTN|nr:CoA transferase [Natronoglycomyces albus]QSB06464.1 CoA transferase [Natronoglycomyces albus]